MSKNEQERHPKVLSGEGEGGKERRDGSGSDIIKKLLEKAMFIAMILWVIFEMSGRALNTRFWWTVAIVVLSLGIVVLLSHKIPRRLLNTIYRYILMHKKVASRVRWPLVTVLALVLAFAQTIEAQGLVAVVECVHWTEPNAVTSGRTAINVRDWCSMYTISLSTNSPEGVRNPTLEIPEACYIEVKKGNVKQTHRDKEILTLPSLSTGEQIDITAWATCKAERPNAKRVRITHLGGRPAHLDIRKPVTGLAEWVNQHAYIAWGCVVVTICAVLAVVRKRLFGWVHR